MENNAVKKPRICDILGVEVEEEFYVVTGPDVPGNTVENLWMHVDEAGEIKGDGSDPALLNKLIIYAISHPGSVVRRTKPFLSNDELAILRAIKKAYPWAKFLFREKDGKLWISGDMPNTTADGNAILGSFLGCVRIPAKLFPQVLGTLIIDIDSFLAEAEAEAMDVVEEDGVYFIENTVDECNSRITGYFRTFDKAKEALKECSDWYRSKGTGRIYFQKFGADQGSKKVFEF